MRAAYPIKVQAGRSLGQQPRFYAVEHEFVTVKGAGHGLSGAKPDEVARIAGWAAAFVAAHTR